VNNLLRQYCSPSVAVDQSLDEDVCSLFTQTSRMRYLGSEVAWNHFARLTEASSIPNVTLKKMMRYSKLIVE